jgi:hypothetical protein
VSKTAGDGPITKSQKKLFFTDMPVENVKNQMFFRDCLWKTSLSEHLFALDKPLFTLHHVHGKKIDCEQNC